MTGYCKLCYARVSAGLSAPSKPAEFAALGPAMLGHVMQRHSREFHETVAPRLAQFQTVVLSYLFEPVPVSPVEGETETVPALVRIPELVAERERAKQDLLGWLAQAEKAWCADFEVVEQAEAHVWRGEGAAGDAKCRP